MQKGPEHLALGIVPETAPVKGFQVLIKRKAVEGMLGFFLGKSIAQQNMVNKKNTSQKNKGSQYDDQAFLHADIILHAPCLYNTFTVG